MKSLIRVAIEANRIPNNKADPTDMCPFYPSSDYCYCCLFLLPELIPLGMPDIDCPCNIIGHDKVQEFVNNYLGE